MPDVLPAVQTRLITNQVGTRLKTLTAVEVYRGEVGSHPPVLEGDPDGRVSSYVVLYPFGPLPTNDVDLADTATGIDYGMQVTCVAGYPEDAEFLWDRVHALLFRWTPAVDGVDFGSFHLPVGYQPGPVRRDQDVKPDRFWLPLQYVIPATT